MKVLVTEHRARWFFVAHLQSALGTGAAILLGGAMATGLGGRATFALAGVATLLILLAATFRKEVQQHGPQVVVAPTPA